MCIICKFFHGFYLKTVRKKCFNDCNNFKKYFVAFLFVIYWFYFRYCATCESYFPLYQVHCTWISFFFQLKFLEFSFSIKLIKCDPRNNILLEQTQFLQMNWCLYHSEQAQFLGPVTETRMPGPAGRYTCCGQQAFRYETLPGPMVITLNSWYKFRSTNVMMWSGLSISWAHSSNPKR